MQLIFKLLRKFYDLLEKIEEGTKPLFVTAALILEGVVLQTTYIYNY